MSGSPNDVMSGAAAEAALGRRLVVHALRYRVARPHETAGLRELKHDEHLLPMIQRQLRALLDCLPPDNHVTYDIQGLSDQGTDLLVRLRSEDAAEYLGLQVKSHRELMASDLTGKLRQQHSESEDHFGEALYWFPVLAADVSQKNLELTRRLRSISSAFAKKRRTMVIDPGYLVSFLKLRHVEMNGLATITVRAGDPVLAEAKADMLRHPLRSALLLRLVAAAVESTSGGMSEDELLECDWLQKASWWTPWTRSHDGEPAGPVSPWDAQGGLYVPIADSSSPEGDVQFSLDIPNDSHLAWILQSPRCRWSSAAARRRLTGRLPHALAALEAEGEIALRSHGIVAARVSDHPALFALAAEATVKFDYAGDELADYLAAVVLPPAAQPPLASMEDWLSGIACPVSKSDPAFCCRSASISP